MPNFPPGTSTVKTGRVVLQCRNMFTIGNWLVTTNNPSRHCLLSSPRACVSPSLMQPILNSCSAQVMHTGKIAHADMAREHARHTCKHTPVLDVGSHPRALSKQMRVDSIECATWKSCRSHMASIGQLTRAGNPHAALLRGTRARSVRHAALAGHILDAAQAWTPSSAPSPRCYACCAGTAHRICTDRTHNPCHGSRHGTSPRQPPNR